MPAARRFAPSLRPGRALPPKTSSLRSRRLSLSLSFSVEVGGFKDERKPPPTTEKCSLGKEAKRTSLPPWEPVPSPTLDESA